MEAMCRAELEQAHGRLRTRPGRALHVGRVLPSGSGWKNGKVEIRENRGGRPPNAGTMSVEEFVEIVNMMGGIRATARAVGCSAQAISRYSHGVRVVPDQLASQLRALRGRSEHAA